MSLYRYQNCPATVHEQLQQLKLACSKILNQKLTGIYIHGSLALNQFSPRMSDIDVIVVVAEPIPTDIRHQLLKALLNLSKQPYPIEISFLTNQSLQEYSYPPKFELHYSEGWRDRLTEAFEKQELSAWENSY